MPILTIIFVIVIIGLIMWLINTYIPMTQPIKTILNVVVIIFMILWLASLIFPGLNSIRVGR